MSEIDRISAAQREAAIELLLRDPGVRILRRVPELQERPVRRN